MEAAPMQDIKAATLDKLVEKLTSPTATSSPDFIMHFLLTYRTFTTPEELFVKLVARYAAAMTNTGTPESELELVRLRVLNVVQSWIERFPKDFADQEQKQLVYIFANAIVKNRKTAKTLIKLVTHQPLPHLKQKPMGSCEEPSLLPRSRLPDFAGAAA
jgi:hypothetical protein